MSVAATSAVFKHAEGRAGEILVMLVLADAADDFGFVVHLHGADRHSKRLAKKARCSRSSWYNYIAACVKSGQLVHVPTEDVDQPSIYRLTLPGLETAEELGQGCFLGPDGKPLPPSLGHPPVQNLDSAVSCGGKTENLGVQNLDSEPEKGGVQNLDVQQLLDGGVQELLDGGVQLAGHIRDHNQRTKEEGRPLSEAAAPDGAASTVRAVADPTTDAKPDPAMKPPDPHRLARRWLLWVLDDFWPSASETIGTPEEPCEAMLAARRTAQAWVRTAMADQLDESERFNHPAKPTLLARIRAAANNPKQLQRLSALFGGEFPFSTGAFSATPANSRPLESASA